MELKRNEKLDVVNILKDLDKYEPRRRGWTWRKKAEEYRELAKQFLPRIENALEYSRDEFEDED